MTSERVVPAGPSDERQARYVQEIIDLNRRLRFGGLARNLRREKSAYVADHGFGMVSVAARTECIPRRYQLGLAGFRLAQYLQLSYASAQVVAERSMFCESIAGWHPADLHCVVLDSDSGELLGYVTLAHNGDNEAVSVLEEGRRSRFPCEVAHEIDLFTAVSAPSTLLSREVREIKRFVHSRSLGDRTRRLRVSLELLLALSRTIEAEYPGIRALVGDVEPQVALRHLVMTGLDVKMVEGTAPWLPAGDLMHPLYTARSVVQPFFALVPERGVVAERVRRMEQAATSRRVVEALIDLSSMRGSVETAGVAA
jgi:hypothetical protein